MSQTTETQILECERALTNAMIKSDVLELDKLLADDLVFTNHLGQVVSKQDDLNAHQTKAIQLESIEFSEPHIKVLGDTSIVTLKANIVGCFNGESSNTSLRFTRVWTRQPDNKWQVIAAHSSIEV
jgi:ketosteroid isomerase-like protein